MSEFVPEKIEVPKDYRKDELSSVYADAAELGLWVREFGAGPTGNSLCGVGSIYVVQKLEFENPEIGELDPWKEFTLGDCVNLGFPGVGASRVESINNAIEGFKTSSLWLEHQMMHERATAE